MGLERGVDRTLEKWRCMTQWVVAMCHHLTNDVAPQASTRRLTLRCEIGSLEKAILCSSLQYPRLDLRFGFEGTGRLTFCELRQ
jgi:hypothetical protein